MSVENQERVCFCRTYSLILLFCNCLMDSPDAVRDQWEVHVGRIVARCKVTQDDNRFWLANQEIIANTQNNYFAHKATKLLLEIHYLFILRIRCGESPRPIWLSPWSCRSVALRWQSLIRVLIVSKLAIMSVWNKPGSIKSDWALHWAKLDASARG